MFLGVGSLAALPAPEVQRQEWVAEGRGQRYLLMSVSL